MKQILSIVFTTSLLLFFQGCGKFEALSSIETSSLSSQSIQQDTNNDGIIFTEADLNTANNGVTLYTENCASCHSSISKSTKLGRTSAQIKGAINTVITMNLTGLKSISDGDIQKISFALKIYNLYGHIPEVDPVLPDEIGESSNSPPPLTQFMCKDVTQEDPAPSPIRRLSRYQLFLTTKSMIEHLIKELKLNTSVSSSILDTENQTLPRSSHLLGPMLSMIPTDDIEYGYSRMDLSVTSEHVENYVMLASELVDYAIQIEKVNSIDIPKVCMWSSPTETCVTSFIRNFGKLALRRPLKADEVIYYKSIYDTSAASAEIGLQTLVMSFLLSPQYLLHLEIEGSSVADRDGVYRLTPYELAARVSYLYLDSMPDSSLLADADSGVLLTPSGLNAQIDRLTKVRQYDILSDPNTYWRKYAIRYLPGASPGLSTSIAMTYSQMYREWLGPYAGIDNHPLNLRLGGTNSFPGKILSENGGFGKLNTATNLEIDEFFFRHFWQKNSKFSDLLLDSSSFIENGAQAAAYNLVPDRYSWLEGHKLVTLPEQAGLLTRIRTLHTGDPSSNPIKRGVFIRTKILCDNLPHPDIDALPDRSIETPEENFSLTTRQRYEQKTADVQCMTCHSQINPLGFAFEDFNQFGYKRNREYVFSSIDTRNYLADLPVDATVNNLELGQDEVESVNGGIEMSRTLASSPKANACFVRQVFRFSMGRVETNGDDCLFSDMYKKMKEGSIQDMIRGIALHPHFKIRKVGPQ